MDDNTRYGKTGANKVWIANGQSYLENRRCTIKLTISTDGSTLPPLNIFCGKGLQIDAVQKKQ